MAPQTRTADVLVVDDEPEVCKFIETWLERHEFECVCTGDPDEGRRILDGGAIKVLVADIAMPGQFGLELLSHIRSNSLPCKVILVSGLCDTEDLTRALNLGAYDFLIKPLDMAELAGTIQTALESETCVACNPLPRRAARALQQEAQLRQASLDSIRALVHAVEAKDPYTRLHSEQVAHYATALAGYLENPSLDVESVHIAALLHDIGKIGVPDHVLTKPGRLTDEEFAQIRRHPGLSSEILGHIPMFAKEAVIVRYHHERWDGRGYPDGLSGEEIPLASRVIHVADAMDAMLMARTYKDAYSVGRMVDELARGAGTQFDPQIAAKMIQWCHSHRDSLILSAPVV
ncbi:MAG: response regulator [Planctomycetes bacterium]|nr:response regulator [Planctomycetota bacterium]